MVWFFSHLGFWSGNLFLIAPFPDLCLLVPFYIQLDSIHVMGLYTCGMGFCNYKTLKYYRFFDIFFYFNFKLTVYILHCPVPKLHPSSFSLKYMLLNVCYVDMTRICSLL